MSVKKKYKADLVVGAAIRDGEGKNIAQNYAKHNEVIHYSNVESVEYDGSGDGQPVAKLRVDLTAEIAARKAADSDEQTARQNAVNNEKALREAAVSNEATARQQADANLQSQINGKAATSHTHTKSEISDFAHNHAEVHSFYTTLETIN